jgi:hypothetical protein
MTGEARNLAASVRARLLAGAKSRGEDFNVVLRRYGIEGVLRRLAASPHSGRFVLKGAMLFVVWAGRIHRPTRDLDLLGSGANDPGAVADVFRQLCAIPVEDGLDFSSPRIAAESIVEAGQYRGVRVKFEGLLERARISVQVDVGFGDEVVPAPEVVEFPSLLEIPGPRVRAYPREAMIAEKLHAMVTLGENNSRMKDFHDIVELSETWPFDGMRLSSALAATFGRRGMDAFGGSPAPAPFFADAIRSGMWQAFHRKLETPNVPADFAEVGERLRRFLEPVMEAVGQSGDFDRQWRAGGPWQ